MKSTNISAATVPILISVLIMLWGFACIVHAQQAGNFPVPTARVNPDINVSLDTLQRVADRHAHEVWGADVSVGPNFPVVDKDGVARAYVFNYRQGALGFPSFDTIFRAIRDLRAEYRLELSGTDRRLVLPPRFHEELERRVGRLGAVMVAATRQDFPILSVHHSVHPYFLYADAAVEKAQSLVNQENLSLHRVYYFGPHELYFGFRPRKGEGVLIHAQSLKPEKPSKVFERSEWAPLNPSLSPLRARAWSEYTEQRPRAIQAPDVGSTHTLKLIAHYKLVPIVDWTYWCVPTAMTMTAGFWDNYEKGTGTVAGYGRLIDFWLINGTGNNVPNFIDEIIDPSTGTWSSQGFIGTLNNTNGYNFSWTQTRQGTNNDWAWPILQGEIDAGRPAMWSVVGVHSMTAIGYRISGSQKFAVVYSTWGTTAQAQYSEYNYNQWGGATVSQMDVGQLMPGGGTAANHSILIGPDGGEVVFGPTPVRWYSWSSSISKTDLETSYDSGASWTMFDAGVATKPGWNTRTWSPTQQSTKTRIRIRSNAAGGTLVSADGSHTDFNVSLFADLVALNSNPAIGPVGMCKREADGKLAIFVRNQGTVPAPASKAKVIFLTLGTSVSNNVSQIAPGGTAKFKVDIPAMCFDPDCEFRIEVDTGGQVVEANESNNAVIAWCIS